MYRKGLHIINSIQTEEGEHLHRFEAFKPILDHVIMEYRLQKLGEVYHNFDPWGFTAVICLSESHISVHTWPEHKLVNYDIYLSNYMGINNNIVHQIDRLFQSFFKGAVIQSQHITR